MAGEEVLSNQKFNPAPPGKLLVRRSLPNRAQMVGDMNHVIRRVKFWFGRDYFAVVAQALQVFVEPKRSAPANLLSGRKVVGNHNDPGLIALGHGSRSNVMTFLSLYRGRLTRLAEALLTPKAI